MTGVLEPALVRAALGPPAIVAETDAALAEAGFALAALRRKAISPPAACLAAGWERPRTRGNYFKKSKDDE